MPSSWQKEAVTVCLGCGDGFELDVLKEMGFEKVCGVTNDPREEGDAIYHTDIHDMSELFEDGIIEQVYSKETLEHLICPWAALLEINRIMPEYGRFLHLVSTGLKKQQETYHVSCFPEWLWIDLLNKAGFRVLKILDGHETELGLYGVKERDVDCMDKVNGEYAYDLQLLIDSIPRETLKI